MKKYFICMLFVLGFSASGFSQVPQGNSSQSNETKSDLFKDVACPVIKWGDDVAETAKKYPPVGTVISETIKKGTTPANEAIGCPKPATANPTQGSSTAKLP